MTQRKFCQENSLSRTEQGPQEYVLCVYVWLYSDSFYQFHNDVSEFLAGCLDPVRGPIRASVQQVSKGGR